MEYYRAFSQWNTTGHLVNGIKDNDEKSHLTKLNLKTLFKCYEGIKNWLTWLVTGPSFLLCFIDLIKAFDYDIKNWREEKH